MRQGSQRCLGRTLEAPSYQNKGAGEGGRRRRRSNLEAVYQHDYLIGALMLRAIKTYIRLYRLSHTHRREWPIVEIIVQIEMTATVSDHQLVLLCKRPSTTSTLLQEKLNMWCTFLQTYIRTVFAFLSNCVSWNLNLSW